jgi:hypothetical protein
MSEQTASPAEEPHDVLAADEFAMPAPDPRLGRQHAHDVLAAEEFGMPTPDPRLRLAAVPVVLPVNPSDPRGADPARDVLAAEEFAMPAAGPRAVPPDYSDTAGPAGPTTGWFARAGVGAAALLMLRRRRKRKAAKRAAAD